MAESEEIEALTSRVIEAIHDLINEKRPAPEVAHDLDRLRTHLVRLEIALRPFVGIAAEWDYNPARRPEIEREIVLAAESLRRNLER